ncbi:MAG: hypothetical protein K9M57_06130 [Phycisphaerae bacterium]|nr:hypothetical protein [Phycisphaerae bacterium]
MPLHPTAKEYINAMIRTVAVPKMMLCMMLVVCLATFSGCQKEGASTDGPKKTTINESFASGPLTVHVTTDRATLDIAQTVTVQLTARIDNQWAVTFPEMPALLAESEHWNILEVDSLPEKLGDKNQIIQARTYRLEPLSDGELVLPELTFTFRKKSDKDPSKTESQLKTTPVKLTVTTTVGDIGETPRIDDIKGVVELPAPWWPWWVWVSIGGGVILLIALVVWLRGRRRVEKIVRVYRPAHEIALERLQKLIAENLIADKKVKEFYQRISHILRLYIEHRFDLRAPERTTEEFFQETALTHVLNAEQKEKLGDFLNHCDLVKFARYGPTEDEIQKTIEITQDFIETTQVDEKQVEICLN